MQLPGRDVVQVFQSKLFRKALVLRLSFHGQSLQQWRLGVHFELLVLLPPMPHRRGRGRRRINVQEVIWICTKIHSTMSIICC